MTSARKENERKRRLMKALERRDELRRQTVAKDVRHGEMTPPVHGVREDAIRKALLRISREKVMTGNRKRLIEELENVPPPPEDKVRVKRERNMRKRNARRNMNYEDEKRRTERAKRRLRRRPW